MEVDIQMLKKIRGTTSRYASKNPEGKEAIDSMKDFYPDSRTTTETAVRFASGNKP